MKLICSVEGCEKAAHAKGLCPMHYQRHRTHGDVHALHPNKGVGCLVEGCENPHGSKGFCALHYSRWKRLGDPLRLVGTAPGAPLAFLEWAATRETDDCIPWPFAKGKYGHPIVAIDGRSTVACREVLLRTQGPPPSPRHQAAHAPVVCHNPSCVNPRHLRWASPSENSADRHLDGTHHQGERVNGARLTVEQVVAIRADQRGHREIAMEYGIDTSHVSGIKSRRTWRHV